MLRGQPLEAIDTRWVFRIYAAIASLSGLLLSGWGPMWFGTDLAGQPWGKAALIRILGAILIAAACWALGFAATDNPRDRRRGLLWFAVGHTVIWLAVLIQYQTTISNWSVAGTAAELLCVCAAVLFVIWATCEGDFARVSTLTTVFGSRTPGGDERLRSQYEQQIREVARQEERNRLARDLHDSVKQQIFVIQTAAATAQARFDGDQPGARQALDQIRGAAREAVAEMQAMLDQLRAMPIENAGLIDALKKQCEALGFRTGAQVKIAIGKLPPAESLAPGAHEAILRAAQEAVANIGRHARAGTVLVSLTSEFGYVDLRIRDDGAGFDPNQASPGQGIANMRARAEEFRGKFELTSQPGNGTSVVFSIPYTTSERPRNYLLRAAFWGVMLVVHIVVLARRESAIAGTVAALCVVFLVRYLVAYRRALRRKGAAR